jgi:hypothetical protein
MTYILSATQDQIWDAIVKVNEWIAERSPSDMEAIDADGFQKALAVPPPRPDGGDHDDDHGE